jgi:hypothetical protein
MPPCPSAAGSSIALGMGKSPRHTDAMSTRLAFFVFSWLLLVVAFVFYPVASVPFFGDDIYLLEGCARYLGGTHSFASYLFEPQNSHRPFLTRLLFLANYYWFGTEAVPLRLALLFTHLVGAMGVTLFFRRQLGSTTAAWVAGTLYAAAAGYTRTGAWYAANFTFTGTFLILGLVALSYDRERPRLAMAGACAAIVLIGLSSQTLVPIALTLAAYVGFANTTSGTRSRAAVLMLVSGALFGLLTLVGNLVIPINIEVAPSAAGARNTAWLLWLAPIRFALFLGRGITYPGDFAAFMLGGAGWLIVVLLGWMLPRQRTRVLLTTTLGAATLAIAMGLARSTIVPAELFGVGRYWYFLLLPLCLFAGCVVDMALDRIDWLKGLPGGAITVSTAVLLILFAAASHTRNLSQTPWMEIELQADALERGRLLADLMKTQATHAPPPGPLADGYLPTGAIHKSDIALSALYFSRVHLEDSPLRLTVSTITKDAADWQNSLLDDWAEQVGLDQSPVCVVDGRLIKFQGNSYLDFRHGPGDDALISGMYDRVQDFRWMGSASAVQLLRGRGDLIVESFVPAEILRAVRQKGEEIRVHVRVDGVLVGDIVYVDQESRRDRFAVPHELAQESGRNHVVTVSFDSPFVWAPSHVLPGASDSRRMSIALRAIGFRNPCR